MIKKVSTSQFSFIRFMMYSSIFILPPHFLEEFGSIEKKKRNKTHNY